MGYTVSPYVVRKLLEFDPYNEFIIHTYDVSDLYELMKILEEDFYCEFDMYDVYTDLHFELDYRLHIMAGNINRNTYVVASREIIKSIIYNNGILEQILDSFKMSLFNMTVSIPFFNNSRELHVFLKYLYHRLCYVDDAIYDFDMYVEDMSPTLDIIYILVKCGYIHTISDRK